ncbi:hypothetical protein AB0A74_03990 [Saccharothrix sp. NPDC042600]|uniref:hypothetical protein n=1 Tax=Saccharothrix TaxID=2071 RepID=UPI0033D66757|nr:hypothetical protein GCM10017745_88510 [Saccharothrix mutabilis subsp. capreolus]
MSVNMVATPGHAAAACLVMANGLPTLGVYLDPVNLTVQVPPFPGGREALARFCRELSREAWKVADRLELAGGRHALAEGAGDGTAEEA